MKIQFLGAVGTVTGSKFLVTSGSTKIMIDCGMFQGLKALRLQNWKKLPVDEKTVDAVVLTHAHVDHSGLVPAFVKHGFNGPIYCSKPTKELCSILLPDCGRIAEEDASYANKKGFSKHKPALPLYTEEEARKSMRQFKTIPLDQDFQIGALTIQLRCNGHILGATNVTVSDGRKSMVFSGDIGRYNDLLENGPVPIPGGDWVAMETTYGDREHSLVDPVEKIAEIVNRTAGRGGVLLIPSFAVGRTQTLLYCLKQAFTLGMVERLPVYVNSPMATSVTRLYQKFTEWHRLSAEECDATCEIAHFVSSAEESKKLNRRKGPMVIISASGMVTGGRVLHHIKQFASDPHNTILLPGFQAEGTRGAALAQGAESVKIHGEYVPIHAEVIQLDMYSAHADRNELIRWLTEHKKAPHKLFLVHGEAKVREIFRKTIQEKFDFPVVTPHHNDTFEL